MGNDNMAQRAPEFSLALTHVFKGVARFTKAKVASQRDDLENQKADDSRRRTQILQKLYNDHATEMAELGNEFAYRGTLPPDGWVNDRLTSLGERWRVHNVDGFRCEIYDAMS
ncbi:MAG TPA: hypothetical protein PLN33_00245 [Hyphomonadaceae bacterium]|nr:hypothetical protein [Hyphomonadaceae bacterium]HPN04800.1 hypothetical protein [Hyphomonadaceae bacterium]